METAVYGRRAATLRNTSFVDLVKNLVCDHVCIAGEGGCAIICCDRL